MKKRLLVLAAALMTLAPVSASAAGFVAVGRPYHVAFYRPFWGPSFGWGWGWGPGYWGPGYWGPGYYGYYPNTGEIKLDTKVKDAQVFVNGAYAGTTHDNKTMYLRPGQYKIEIREPGREPFVQNVYVTLDKAVHLRPDR